MLQHMTVWLFFVVFGVKVFNTFFNHSPVSWSYTIYIISICLSSCPFYMQDLTSMNWIERYKDLSEEKHIFEHKILIIFSTIKVQSTVNSEIVAFIYYDFENSLLNARLILTCSFKNTLYAHIVYRYTNVRIWVLSSAIITQLYYLQYWKYSISFWINSIKKTKNLQK